MKTRPAEIRLRLTLAMRRLALAGALASVSLTGAFADHGMTQPEMPMEHDSPMGPAMPMEDDPVMRGTMPSDSGAMPPMGPMKGRMGMEKPEMGRMRAGEKNQVQMESAGASAQPAAARALPGFSGTPRVYHMGATGLFLDHPEHITLTAKQQDALQAIKTKAARNQASYREQIEKAEDEVWALTGAERPDADALDRKIRAIEAMRREQRMDYVRFVGEAAKVLTEGQRRQLTGLADSKPSGPAPAAVSDQSAHKPDPKGK